MISFHFKKFLDRFVVFVTMIAVSELIAQAPPVPQMDNRPNLPPPMEEDLNSPIYEPSNSNTDSMPMNNSNLNSPAPMNKIPMSPDSPPSSISGSTGTTSQTPTETLNIPKTKKAADVPPGQELVSIHFPDPTEMNDIVKAISMWMGKNVILDPTLKSKQVQIISPRKVTKEEAYQTFLSALNTLGYTTVETGKVMKIVQIPGSSSGRSAKGNFKTFLGSDWTPRTDEVITQIIPLKYIDASKISTTLQKITSASNINVYEPTNTLIVTESGYKVRNVLDVVKLLDVQGQQSQVAIVPIRHADAKDIAKKVGDIFGGSDAASKSAVKKYFNYKIMTDERSNSVVVFGPPRTIADVKELVKKFDIALDDPTRQSSIHVRPLDYADATKIAATLNNLVSGKSSSSSSSIGSRRPLSSRLGGSEDSATADLGEGVKITADESSNSLLITGSRSAYQSINALIRKLDVRKSQVFIESDILDVTLNDNFKFGLSTLLGDKPKSGGIDFLPVGWQAGDGIGNVIASTATNSSGAAINSNGAAGLASAFANDLTIGILSNVDVNFAGIGSITTGAMIKMLKTDSNTKALASPQILTSNNEEANITVGETAYFTLDGEQNTTTGLPIKKTEKVNANLSLTVKPNISHSNYITMGIKVEADSIGSRGNSSTPPSVNVRKSSQNVTVKNKQTIVISGLTKTTEIDTLTKIPLLGDIPILGWLFRNTSKEKLQANLMIFLTPYIVHGANDLADIYASKRKSTDEFLYKIYGSRFKKSDFNNRLPTYDDGKYVEDPIDKLEDERRSQMLKAMYEENKAIDSSASLPGSTSETDPIDSDTSTTVPVSVGGDDFSSGFSGSNQPVAPSIERSAPMEDFAPLEPIESFE